MAHVLISGITESGKTTLARALAARYKRAQVGVLVLDPLADPRWPADFRTSNEEEFLQVFWQSRRCMAFMDEGGESVGRYNTAMQKTATRGRHWGHSCYYITQRVQQLAPIVRDMCIHLFLFASSKKDGLLLAGEFNHPDLEGCNTLKTGEYIHAIKMGSCTRHKLNIGARNATNDSDSRTSGSDNRADSAGREETESGAGGGNSAEAAGVGASN